MSSKVPKEYKEAFAEADRLFDAGLLTSELFDPLYDKATKSIDGLPSEGDLVESFMLIAPADWLSANTEAEED